MRKNNCDVIRRELDELTLDEACSPSAVAHLKECFACREFHQTQTKLRRMVGSLGTVAAPADFDFRLRARLANDAGEPAFRYWAFARKGFALAAVLVVFVTAIAVVRSVMNEQTKKEVAENPPVQQNSPKPVEVTTLAAPASSKQLTATVKENGPRRIKNERAVQTASRIKPRLSTIDQTQERADVISGIEPGTFGATAVFPIDASLQSFRISLDDGRGNARTVSVPTIRFGSQRMLPGNQFAQKNIW